MARIEGMSGVSVGADMLSLESQAFSKASSGNAVVQSARARPVVSQGIQFAEGVKIPAAGSKIGSGWSDDALRLLGGVLKPWGGRATSQLSCVGNAATTTLSSFGSSLSSMFSGTSLMSGMSSWGRSAMSGLSTVGGSIAKAGGAAWSTGATVAGGAATAVGKAMPFVGIVQGGVGLVQNFGKPDPVGGAINGMGIGSSIGSMCCPVVGTAIGAVVGAVAGGLLGCISSGKHGDQKQRDTVRSVLMQAGVIDKNYTLPLADGSRYDIGKDGGKRAEFGGLRPFEVDFNRPFAQKTVEMALEVAKLFSNGNQKIESDFAGYFANAAMSNAATMEQVEANIESIKSAFGIPQTDGIVVTESSVD